MKKSLIITDLTRMQEGRVCVAGYDESGNCIRPVLPPPGIYENTLYSQGKPAVFPFAVVEYDLLQHIPQSPHTEDYRYDPSSVRFLERLEEKHREKVLSRTLFPGVKDIFEVPIFSDFGHYVIEGQGPRSLGTIRPRQVIKIIYELSPESNWKYRIGFADGNHVTYWLTITDLAWRYYSDYQRRKGAAPEAISSRLMSYLKSSKVYLRVGLARGWEKYPNRCFLQITGVYTFPDYLHGGTFANFAPERVDHVFGE